MKRSSGKKEIIEPIGRHPILRKQMAVIPEGRNAHTVVDTLCCNGELSYVKIMILTGRTHQIRVHLQHHKTPVLGDQVYGNARVDRKYGNPRLQLHATYISLMHPIKDKKMEFFAPIPSEMQIFVDKLTGSHLF